MEDSSRNSRPVKNWTYKWHQIEPSEQRLRHGHTHTHTHLYINNHSPSTQFIYILFVPFHLSTCRNNPVRVRNIIEVFFFLSSFHHRIFSNEVVCSNGTLEEKTGNKDVSPYVGSKPRCCWSESGCVFKWVLLWGRSQHNRIRTEHVVTERICDSIPSLRSVDTTTLNGHERRPIRYSDENRSGCSAVCS